MKYKLSDLCSYVKEKVPVSKLSNKTYVSTENMLPNKAGITAATTIPTTDQTQAYTSGDVLVSNIRPYFKKIWHAANDGGCSNDVLVFRAKPECDSTFLYYVLSDDRFFEYATATSKGTKMPRGDKTAILEYEVPNYDITAQRQIATTLVNIDKKIEINRKINDNLTAQFRAVVDHFLEELAEYDEHRLDEVANCQNGHAFYKEGYDEEGALVIDLGNVDTSANFIYTNADKYISLERYNHSKMNKFRVFKDDLVMVMTDRKSTMELLGKTGKIYKDGYYLLNQRMYRIRANAGINVNYLYAILNSTSVCSGLKEKALGSVQKYVNTGAINEIKIKVPSSEKMEELSAIVNPIIEQMEVSILENEALVALRDCLLPDLISGELAISNT